MGKLSILAASLAVVWANGLHAAPAAQIVSIQGDGQFRPGETVAWSAARVEQALDAGNFVRTGDFSRMGLLFADRTQLRLSEKSVLQVRTGEAGTRVRLDLGRAWTQSKTLPQRLSMETPSATAAIRGTDWDIEVDASGRTVITVLSGEVDFFNDHGRLTVRANEAAEARVGQPPSRLVVVNPRDRVQWVGALTIEPLRHVWLAAGEGDGARRLADQGAWTDAEAAMRAGAGDAIGLGFAALHRGALDEARTWFDRAGAPSGRDGELLALGRIAWQIGNRQLAAAQAALRQLLARGPTSQPAPYLLLAELAQYAGDPTAAGQFLDQGLRAFVNDGDLIAAKARLALYADRREEAAQLLANARGTTDRPALALADGERARLEGLADAARSAYQAAINSKPNEDRAWFGLGRVASEREDVGPARVHLARALELYPVGIGYEGERGTLESFANEFAVARAAFDAALKQNPDDYVALTGLGLLELKRGNTTAALEAFLRAGLMEPRYARAHVYTAVAYYQEGRTAQALSELERASQLDDKDPLPYFLSSVIHTDSLDPASAIEASRAALKRLPYLKSLNQLANDQQGLTNLGQAFAFLGMEEWAQRYAQDSYYPFWAGSHLFLADRYFGMFTKNSELFQGFLTDPTVFGGAQRRQNLITRPSFNFGASMRVTRATDVVDGTGPQVQVSGFDNAAFPLAYYIDYEKFNLDFADTPYDQATRTAALGLAPRHDLGLFVFSEHATLETRALGSYYDFSQNLVSGRTDLGGHYKLSPDSQIWYKFGEFVSHDSAQGLLLFDLVMLKTRVEQPETAFRHSFSMRGNHELTWGFERGERRMSSDFATLTNWPLVTLSAYRFAETSRDLFFADRWRIGPALDLDLGLVLHRSVREAQNVGHYLYLGEHLWDPELISSERYRRDVVNPRFGLVYRTANELQFRAAYQRWTRPTLFSSLGPVATAGIVLDDRMVMRGGDLRHARAQVEWEVSRRTFATAYIARKTIDNRRFQLSTPFALDNLESLQKLRPRRLGSLANDDLLEFVDTPEWDSGRISTIGLGFNHLLSREWGLFARYQRNSSRNTSADYAGNEVPFIARNVVAAGATWVNVDGWYFISRLVHRAKRYGDQANVVPMAASWNAAGDIYWQSRDKSWLLRFSVDDALDKRKTTQYTAEVTYRY